MEQEPKEPTIEVTDKRRVRLDAEDGDPATPEPAPEPPTTDPPGDADASSDGEDLTGSLPAMDVYGLLQTTIGLLGNGAWAWMGLTHNPFTGKMERDLAQAKIAIDTVAFIADQLDPHLPEEERRELRNTVSMLRINYVQQTQQP